MKLEELVHDIKLCKLIPKGEFEDSALMWVEDVHPTLTPFVEPRRYIILEDEEIPAPTLQEIVAKLESFELGDYYGNSKLYMCDVSFTISEVEESPVIAAFKCWLKLKGIEYEK